MDLSKLRKIKTGLVSSCLLINPVSFYIPFSYDCFCGNYITKGGYILNSITDLLDLEDSEIIVDDIQIQGQTKTTNLFDICPF